MPFHDSINVLNKSFILYITIRSIYVMIFFLYEEQFLRKSKFGFALRVKFEIRGLQFPKQNLPEKLSWRKKPITAGDLTLVEKRTQHLWNMKGWAVSFGCKYATIMTCLCLVCIHCALRHLSSTTCIHKHGGLCVINAYFTTQTSATVFVTQIEQKFKTECVGVAVNLQTFDVCYLGRLLILSTRMLSYNFSDHLLPYVYLIAIHDHILSTFNVI